MTGLPIMLLMTRTSDECLRMPGNDVLHYAAICVTHCRTVKLVPKGG